MVMKWVFFMWLVVIIDWLLWNRFGRMLVYFIGIVLLVLIMVKVIFSELLECWIEFCLIMLLRWKVL